jgi:negative regulator of flagellin synthesis FlgM
MNMVIDPSNPSLNKATSSSSGSKLKPTPGAEPTVSGKTATPAATDNVSLSREAQAMGRLEQALKTSSDVDETKVAALRQAIAEGKYQVNSERIAERMLVQDDWF